MRRRVGCDPCTPAGASTPMREVQDHYFKLAKQEGYLSRAAYKLIEIDERRKVLHRGDRVLDCGSAPGSWLQVAARRVGLSGVVVGIDLQPIAQRFEGNVKVLQGDFTTTPPAELLRAAGDDDRRFDVVLSDMAPNTSGDPESDHFRSVRLCDALLTACSDLLRVGGNLVMKVFEGAAYRELVQRVEQRFDSAKGFKPKASRSESVEMFIVALGHRSPASTDASSPAMPAKPWRPSTGWGKN